MATTLPPSTDYTGAAVTQGGKKTFMTSVRTFIADLFATSSDMATAHAAFKNFGVGTANNAALAATVATGALTIALKSAAAVDPSAGDPVLHAFRSATLTTGTPSLLAAAAAQSLVIPSGATMGAVNGTPFRLWVVQFNDGGVLRLGAINCLSGTSIYPLRDDVLASSTAVSAAADNAQVIYTGTAVTSKAMRVLGYMEWASGLTTAGTWDAAPTKIQMYAPGQSLPGQTVQVQENFTGAVATGTTVIPLDDTIPQNTEGDQYMSQAITPTSAANVLRVHSAGMFTHSTANGFISALFQDSAANALKAGVVTIPGVGFGTRQTLNHSMLAATSVATTFKLRAGSGAAGTTTFNGGSGGTRLLGGVENSMLTVTEVMA